MFVVLAETEVSNVASTILCSLLRDVISGELFRSASFQESRDEDCFAGKGDIEYVTNNCGITIAVLPERFQSST